MTVDFALLWRAPEINPINHKARSVPVLNPINHYGRVRLPTAHDIITKDLHLTQVEVSNSNIVALAATLTVRLIAGPACDRFGPRWTFAACLLIGAIPTFLAGTVYNVHQLYACRFFVGILGGSFVPCQVWTTGSFDKNIVGTANALTAGLGNAGGGITYFLMPAIYESLVGDGLRPHVAWRVTFVVPGVIIVSVALALLLLCADTPTGKWEDRPQAAEATLRQQSANPVVVQVPGSMTPRRAVSDSGTATPSSQLKDEKKLSDTHPTHDDAEALVGEQAIIEAVRGAVIQKPTLHDILRVSASPQTIALGAAYFCTFGGELAINSILGAYYQARFRNLNLQTASNWAAMFGLVNVVFRPLGGVVADFAYARTSSVWVKKILLHSYGLVAGSFLVAIGLANQHSLAALVCLVGVGMAFFLEGANGLVFSLVPHVHPQANGVVSGFTGACGNLGGIVFAIVFRYHGKDYKTSIWIIGVIIMTLNVAVCWIKPVPKGQTGGR